MILVGTTMTGFACASEDTSLSWLANAEAMREATKDEVQFFAALETDARGLGPFERVIARLDELGGLFHTFSYDDGRTSVDTSNRLWHLCMGRDLVTNRAIDSGASHLLYLDADVVVLADSIEKLLELNGPLVGGHVGTYNLSGPPVEGYPAEWDVQRHWNTAGFLLVERSVFRTLRWRYDGEGGMTDDPTYARDAREFLGLDTYVRHDVVGTHMPQSIVPIEHRHEPEILKVHR